MPPRSPSRDLSDRYTGNRQYFRRGNWLTRWRWRLAGLALVVVAGWVAAGYLMPAAERDYRYTHGPLANVHAMWDSDCEKCHKPTDPAGQSVRNVLRADHRWLDLTCTTCHPGPPHFAGQNVKEGGADGCASCHPDHRGRDFSLVNLADTGCTQCHGDLSKHPEMPQGRIQQRIASFAEHPEFRALLDEQSTKKYQAGRGLKFSHAVHLSPGIVLPGAANKFTVGDLEKLSPGAGGRLQPGKPATAAVELDCAACHQLDGRAGTKGFSKVLDALAATPRGSGPAGAEGAYFLPVKYDLHCKVCHPTTAGQTAVGGTVLPSVPVPHGEQPDAIEKFLEGAYARALVSKDEKLQALKPAAGERFDPRPSPEAKAVGEALRAAVEKGMKDSILVRPIGETARGEGCLKCHDLVLGEGKYGRVRPVSQKSVWFGAARFTHAPHLNLKHVGVTCVTCHPGAGAQHGADGRLVEREPLDILGVESCKTCHGPKTDVPGSGARSTCTECHRYHLGERPTRAGR